MAFILRLKGLAWSAAARDIRNFFSGLTIPDGGVHIIGGENGDAFVRFPTEADIRRGLEKTGGFIHNSQVSLSYSSLDEMTATIQALRSESSSKSEIRPNSGPYPLVQSGSLSQSRSSVQAYNQQSCEDSLHQQSTAVDTVTPLLHKQPVNQQYDQHNLGHQHLDQYDLPGQIQPSTLQNNQLPPGQFQLGQFQAGQFQPSQFQISHMQTDQIQSSHRSAELQTAPKAGFYGEPHVQKYRNDINGKQSQLTNISPSTTDQQHSNLYKNQYSSDDYNSDINYYQAMNLRVQNQPTNVDNNLPVVHKGKIDRQFYDQQYTVGRTAEEKTVNAPYIQNASSHLDTKHYGTGGLSMNTSNILDRDQVNVQQPVEGLYQLNEFRVPNISNLSMPNRQLTENQHQLEGKRKDSSSQIPSMPTHSNISQTVHQSESNTYAGNKYIQGRGDLQRFSGEILGPKLSHEDQIMHGQYFNSQYQSMTEPSIATKISSNKLGSLVRRGDEDLQFQSTKKHGELDDVRSQPDMRSRAHKLDMSKAIKQNFGGPLYGRGEDLYHGDQKEIRSAAFQKRDRNIDIRGLSFVRSSDIEGDYRRKTSRFSDIDDITSSKQENIQHEGTKSFSEIRDFKEGFPNKQAIWGQHESNVRPHDTNEQKSFPRGVSLDRTRWNPYSDSKKDMHSVGHDDKRKFISNESVPAGISLNDEVQLGKEIDLCSDSLSGIEKVYSKPNSKESSTKNDYGNSKSALLPTPEIVLPSTETKDISHLNNEDYLESPVESNDVMPLNEVIHPIKHQEFGPRFIDHQRRPRFDAPFQRGGGNRFAGPIPRGGQSFHRPMDHGHRYPIIDPVHNAYFFLLRNLPVGIPPGDVRLFLTDHEIDPAEVHVRPNRFDSNSMVAFTKIINANESAYLKDQRSIMLGQYSVDVKMCKPERWHAELQGELFPLENNPEMGMARPDFIDEDAFIAQEMQVPGNLEERPPVGVECHPMDHVDALPFQTVDRPHFEAHVARNQGEHVPNGRSVHGTLQYTNEKHSIKSKCVQIENLPPDVDDRTLTKLFEGLPIVPNGLFFERDLQQKLLNGGVVYIEFENEMAADEACNKNGLVIDNDPIGIQLIPREHALTAINKHQELILNAVITDKEAKEACVMITNLPPCTNKATIRRDIIGIERFPTGNIFIEMKENNVCTGTAYIRYNNKREMYQTMGQNGKVFFENNISVQLITVKEADKFIEEFQSGQKKPRRDHQEIRRDRQEIRRDRFIEQTRDQPGELRRDHPQEPRRDHPQEPRRDHPQEPRRDHPQEPRRDHPQEPRRDHPQEPRRGHIQDRRSPYKSTSSRRGRSRSPKQSRSPKRSRSPRRKSRSPRRIYTEGPGYVCIYNLPEPFESDIIMSYFNDVKDVMDIALGEKNRHGQSKIFMKLASSQSATNLQKKYHRTQVKGSKIFVDIKSGREIEDKFTSVLSIFTKRKESKLEKENVYLRVKNIPMSFAPAKILELAGECVVTDSFKLEAGPNNTTIASIKFESESKAKSSMETISKELGNDIVVENCNSI